MTLFTALVVTGSALLASAFGIVLATWLRRKRQKNGTKKLLVRIQSKMPDEKGGPDVYRKD